MYKTTYSLLISNIQYLDLSKFLIPLFEKAWQDLSVQIYKKYVLHYLIAYTSLYMYLWCVCSVQNGTDFSQVYGIYKLLGSEWETDITQ